MSGRGRLAIDLKGKRFGRLIALTRAPKLAADQARHAYWICECDCGESTIVRGSGLLQGMHKSCGCLLRESSRRRALAYKASGCNQFGRRQETDILIGVSDWREARRRMRAAGHEIRQYDGIVLVDGAKSNDSRLSP
mgnify:CR=1 FL=1